MLECKILLVLIQNNIFSVKFFYFVTFIYFSFLATATRLVSYGPDDQDGEGEEDEDFEDASDVGNDIFSKFRSSSGVSELDKNYLHLLKNYFQIIEVKSICIY